MRPRPPLPRRYCFSVQPTNRTSVCSDPTPFLLNGRLYNGNTNYRTVGIKKHDNNVPACSLVAWIFAFVKSRRLHATA